LLALVNLKSHTSLCNNNRLSPLENVNLLEGYYALVKLIHFITIGLKQDFSV